MDSGRLRILGQARASIAEASHRRITLADVASDCGYSPFHFHRLFVTAYNETPLEFITKQRLSQARQMLRSTDLSVHEVAFLVGYQSVSTFVTLFKERTGMTPVTYRMQARRIYGVGISNRPPYIPSCFLRFRGIS